MYKGRLNSRIGYGGISVFFMASLLLPLGMLVWEPQRTGHSTAVYLSVLQDRELQMAWWNSCLVAASSALLTTALAFVLAYGIHLACLGQRVRQLLRIGVLLPMLLPTITYGFALLYSFGKQGLLTQLAGRELLNIYGFAGLLLGYVIYTLPVAFLLLHNGFQYIDKKYTVVATLLGDTPLRCFANTVLRPMLGAVGSAYVTAFILSFTDFGIPAAIGGTYPVIATYLYQVMLGALPDFARGAVVAVVMLMPAVVSMLLLRNLERFHFAYESSAALPITPCYWRDISLAGLAIVTVGGIVAIFLVMFVAPFTVNFPYDLRFSSQFVREALTAGTLQATYLHSVGIAAGTAGLGTVIAYGAALLNGRSQLTQREKSSLDVVALITQTVPGMVLGLAYLLLWNGSGWKGGFTILIVCNIVHFFATPYFMAKQALQKLNPAWETTGLLLGDYWLQTVWRVLIPNSLITLGEMAAYYFINAMVTISAVIFLVTAQTAVVTSKIKELQHFASFNEIFVLSLLLFATNLLVKGGWEYLLRHTAKQV